MMPEHKVPILRCKCHGTAKTDHGSASNLSHYFHCSGFPYLAMPDTHLTKCEHRTGIKASTVQS